MRDQKSSICQQKDQDCVEGGGLTSGTDIKDNIWFHERGQKEKQGLPVDLIARAWMAWSITSRGVDQRVFLGASMSNKRRVGALRSEGEGGLES